MKSTTNNQQPTTAPTGRSRPEGRVIVALDVDTFDQARRLLDSLGESVSFYKVGLQLYTSLGQAVIKELRDRDKRIFLDLKFHDIPNTVASVCKVVSSFGVDLCNVHALGGAAMMRAAAAAVEGCNTRVLAVTILTSHTPEAVRDELHIELGLEQEVLALAGLAAGSGLHGVVCSPREIEAVRARCGEGFLIVTPGVRPAWAEANDQKRIMTPAEAVKRGADYLVIGRPITAATDPAAAAARIIDELG
ncbi:MAG: orotidine-5'-phosphate decarboxylase [bacterium]|nr:orotidine-5'-phosphate decarboxylase [bacterium]